MKRSIRTFQNLSYFRKTKTRYFFPHFWNISPSVNLFFQKSYNTGWYTHLVPYSEWNHLLLQRLGCLNAHWKWNLKNVQKFEHNRCSSTNSGSLARHSHNTTILSSCSWISMHNYNWFSNDKNVSMYYSCERNNVLRLA